MVSKLANNLLCLLIIIVGVLLLASVAVAVTPAFPTAEGYGADASGGRGGDVYHVTNLTDDVNNPAPGSLRYGLVNASGPRTIVFDVSGTILLADTLNIQDKSYLTIAGQTSPGGICLKNYDLRFKDCDNIIVRHMRFRPGDLNYPDAPDAIGINDSKNVIIDHCSMSWAIDENVGIGGDLDITTTVQWCIISEGLYDSHHPSGTHSKGLLICPQQGSCTQGSIHHNLFAHNAARNPYCAPYHNALVEADIRNNVIYNWKDALIRAGASTLSRLNHWI